MTFAFDLIVDSRNYPCECSYSVSNMQTQKKHDMTEKKARESEREGRKEYVLYVLNNKKSCARKPLT